MDLLANFRNLKQEVAGTKRNSVQLASSDQPVKIIAVTKTVAIDKIAKLLEIRHFDFGENKIQEATAKWPQLRQQYPDSKLHIIGNLQSNKVAAALDLADYIHSIDREKVITTICQLRDKGKITNGLPKLLIQVNVAKEPQKSGCSIAELPGLINKCRDNQLPVIGLMTIPPFGIDPTPFYRQLARLARDHGLAELSMGMSNDWQTALACGATMLRIGQSIFGSRP